MKKKIFIIFLTIFFILSFKPNSVLAQGDCSVDPFPNDYEEVWQMENQRGTCNDGYVQHIKQVASEIPGDTPSLKCVCIVGEEKDIYIPPSDKEKCLAKNKPPFWDAWVWIEGKGCSEKTLILKNDEKDDECPEGYKKTHSPTNLEPYSLCVYNGESGETPPQIIKPTIQKGVLQTPGGTIFYPKGDCMPTAIGCIPIKPEAFVQSFLTWAIGIAGGIALLLMLFSAFGILTSAGDPEKLKASQERLTSAIIGLLFIIFSVFLLRIIGTPIMELGGS